jgi:hypothetical protein
MRGRATASGGAKRPPDRTVSHFIKAPDAAALSREQRGKRLPERSR